MTISIEKIADHTPGPKKSVLCHREPWKRRKSYEIIDKNMCCHSQRKKWQAAGLADL